MKRRSGVKLTESLILSRELLGHPVQRRLARPILSLRQRELRTRSDAPRRTADRHELRGVRRRLEQRVRRLEQHHRAEDVHGEVVQHILLRRLEDPFGVAQDRGVGDDDVEPSRDALNLFDGGTVVGLVRRGELDDVQLALMTGGELAEGLR
jgi:hypothetical protein